MEGWFWRMCPRSRFRSGGTCERTLVLVSFPGNIRMYPLSDFRSGEHPPRPPFHENHPLHNLRLFSTNWRESSHCLVAIRSVFLVSAEALLKASMSLAQKGKKETKNVQKSDIMVTKRVTETEKVTYPLLRHIESKFHRFLALPQNGFSVFFFELPDFLADSVAGFFSFMREMFPENSSWHKDIAWHMSDTS